MKSHTASAAVLAFTLTGCVVRSDAPSTTVVHEMFGLECRSDMMEMVTSDYGSNAVGEPSPEAALAAFFGLPINNRFLNLELDERDALEASYVDEDGLTQLVIQLTDEFDGFLVAGYSSCADLE